MRTPAEREETGRAARRETPRRSHAEWAPAPDRRDPVDILREQARTRVPDLVPIRYARMQTSPFAFFRGGAAIMAEDLAPTPRSGLRVQLCGDAHLLNFGGFASPDRALVFDVNDFDETLPGPWEWDLKRLAASLAIAGRERGFDDDDRRRVGLAAVARYREQMRAYGTMRGLDVWYARLDTGSLVAEFGGDATARERKAVDRTITKARRKDSTRAFARLTHTVDGAPRIVSDPPLIVPVAELAEGAEAQRIEDGVRALVERYRASLRPDCHRLIDRYEYADLARKVVGVGSVGTRAWIVLLIGRDEGDPLFLQCKEAEPSVLAAYAGASEYENEGRRVVEGQRVMQAASDILLGWLRADEAGGARDYYVRQLWDWKASATVDEMRPRDMRTYGEMCAWALARAHARTGDPIAIGAYLGSGDVFDVALVEFAERYADQNERDHATLVAAIRDGALPVA